MKAGWQKKALGSAFLTVTGNTPPKSNALLYGQFMPLVKPPELCDATLNSAADGLSEAGADVSRTAPPNSILVSCIGNLGKVGLNTIPVAFNQQINAILPDVSKAIPEFMFYQVLSSSFREQLEELASGTTVPIVNKSKFNSIQIVLPPLPEQQRIVGILDAAFDGIATAKAHAEQNLQNARALFESHLQSVFTQRGEGWVEKKLGDTSILKIIDGDRGSNYPSKEDFSDDGFCLFLNTKNVRPEGFNFDTTMFVTEEKDKALRKGKLQRQDVILTTRGTIGNVAIYDEDVEFENIRINSGMLIFRPNTEKILPSFLFEVFRSGIMKAQMTRHVSGAAQPQLPIKTLIDFEIPVPNTLEAQRKIVISVREIDAETQHLESLYQRKLAALDELKKSLLHQAFSGAL